MTDPGDDIAQPGPHARYAAALTNLSSALDTAAGAILDAHSSGSALSTGPIDRRQQLAELGWDCADLRDSLGRLIAEEIDAMPRAA